VRAAEPGSNRTPTTIRRPPNWKHYAAVLNFPKLLGWIATDGCIAVLKVDTSRVSHGVET